MIETKHHERILIRGARLIDPTAGRDEQADVAVVDGRVVEGVDPPVAHVIDAAGLIICPGLSDIHVHLREPGGEHKETIETGTRAAAVGGFTFVACMPNTRPPIDNVATLELVRQPAHAADFCGVGPVAAITLGRAGRQVVDFAALKEAGAVAFSDDGDGVEDEAVMREAFLRAREIDLGQGGQAPFAQKRGKGASPRTVLIQHCEYKHLSAGGVMHEGDVSRGIGMPGLDPRSEEAMIERDIALCRETGGRYHVAHISTARSVELVRRARAEGLPITAEVSVHHLILTDEGCADADPCTKMHPPLRPRADVDACRRGLLDETIDCIVTDHAPHTVEEKERGFLQAPPGIVGLETAVAVAAKAMIESGLADWVDLIRWFTVGPAKVLSRSVPGIKPCAPADLTQIDPAQTWTVDADTFESKSRNTPFNGWSLTARPVATIRGRRILNPKRKRGAL